MSVERQVNDRLGRGLAKVRDLLASDEGKRMGADDRLTMGTSIMHEALIDVVTLLAREVDALKSANA
jgi:hypothetical protein